MNFDDSNPQLVDTQYVTMLLTAAYGAWLSTSFAPN